VGSERVSGSDASGTQEPVRRVPRQFFGHLATFVAVAETLSFRNAAEILGRSQPGISAQIRQLEDYLGIELLVRTTRQVRLTAAGAELLDRAKKIMTETQRLVSDIQAQGGIQGGQIVVSFSPTTAVSLIPPVLTAFVEEYPGVRVLLREDLGAEQIEAVQTANADFGVGPYYRVPEALRFEPVFEQEFFLIVRADHPLAFRGHIRVKELVDVDLLSSSFGTTAREVLDEALRKEGITLAPRFEALQYPTLFTLAASGFGGTVMPLVNRNMLTALGLKAIPFRGTRISRTIGIITRRGEEPAPAANAFIRLLLLIAEQEGRNLGLE